MNSSTILGITGPTASGKTNLGIRLAKKINAEIISVDSAQIYKKLDIGTAKPTLIESEGIQHHLIDVSEPWQKYSIKNFLDDVKSCINIIESKNKKVLLVGGSMLYFKTLIEGISSLPSSNPIIRLWLQKIPIKKLYQFLLKYDPEVTKKLSMNDRQRVERVVEVAIISQQPYSVLVKSNRKIGGLGTRIKLCALIPRERQQLYKNITERFHNILAKGFLNEVETLKNHPRINSDLPSMKCVGYRQAWKYLDGQYSYDSFVIKTISATRNLAKHQLTWIRNWPTYIKLFEFDQDGYINNDNEFYQNF